MNKFLLIVILLIPFSTHAQIQLGVWRTLNGNTDYHQFNRDGGGAAVYINQVSTDDFYPILRLSSGTATADQNVKFTVQNNGYVGIGTTSPSQWLDVKGTILSNNFRTSSTNTSYSQFIRNGNGAAVYINQVSSESGHSILRLSSGTSTANQNVKFTVENNGNVGIGNTNPQYKLVVNGTISASEVKVSASPNSDYVFESDYNLLPITEVEIFIKENKHLPEIPSAEEFKENGVGLGEMDDMLLRKVEELTLYVIEQNKNNEELFKKIEELEEENDELREKVDNQEQEIKKLKNEK